MIVPDILHFHLKVFVNIRVECRAKVGRNAGKAVVENIPRIKITQAQPVMRIQFPVEGNVSVVKMARTVYQKTRDQIVVKSPGNPKSALLAYIGPNADPFILRLPTA